MNLREQIEQLIDDQKAVNDRLLTILRVIEGQEKKTGELTEDVSDIYNEVMLKVCEAFSVTDSELKSPSRKRRIVQARAVIFKAMREQGVSLAAIGRCVNRDHSTVSHGLDLIADLTSYNPILKKQTEEICAGR
jgi:chromosomal replication initiation ATPase DnaA